MNWLASLRKAVDYMEEHLCENISADDVAKDCAISSFYLQKGFSIISGYSIGEYLRNRRLYKAALDLQNTDEKVIDIALKYCYETPESFTKAFSRFHLCTPMDVRNGEKNVKVFVPLKFQISIQGGNEMNCRIEKMDSFKIIGFKKQFNGETSYQEIPKYWDEVTETHAKRMFVEGKEPETEIQKAIMENHIGLYGACVNEQKGGNFDYMIAGPYDGGAVPEGLYVHEFVSGEWVKFECTLKTLQETNTRIFKEWLPSNEDFELREASDIEWYSPDGVPGTPDLPCEIWIPVKRI